MFTYVKIITRLVTGQRAKTTHIMKHLFLISVLLIIVLATSIALLNGKTLFAIIVVFLGLLTIVGYEYAKQWERKYKSQN
jgi:hypothetical protein